MLRLLQATRCFRAHGFVGASQGPAATLALTSCCYAYQSVEYMSFYQFFVQSSHTAYFLLSVRRVFLPYVLISFDVN